MFPRGLLKEYASVLSFIARSLDILAIGVGALLSHWWRFNHINLPGNYQIAILIAMLVSLVLFPQFDLYQSWRGKSRFLQIRTLTSAIFVLFTFLIVIAFVTKTSLSFSRQWIGVWALFTWMLLIANRVVLGQILRLMREKGFNQKRVVILGAGVLGQNVVTRINDSMWTGLDVVAFLDDNEDMHEQFMNGIKVEGALSEIDAIVKSKAIDEVWIALPLRAENRVKEVLDYLKYSTTTIRYVPDIFGFRLMNHSISEIAGMAVIELSGSPIWGINRLAKFIEDRMLALFFLLITSPLMLLIAIGIKLSSRGPVIFKQVRHGYDGHPIKIYKFRSMIVHEEKGNCVTQASKNDPRVTKFGAFLRATSLDELPQFINVLQGRMSIVGPRPHAIAHGELYKDKIDDYMKRHKVKPGITGWAQINGWRGETDTLNKMEKRVEYDLFYIQNWSLWFDLKIIFLTLFKIFWQEKAY